MFQRLSLRIAPKVLGRYGKTTFSTTAKVTQSATRNPVSWYLGLLDRKPLATKMVTAGLITMMGDLTCQKFVESDGTTDLDWGRALKFGSLGMFYIAPVLHVWYGFLARMIPGQAATTVLKRVLTDQLLAAPLIVTSVLGIIKANEAPIEQVPEFLRNEVPPTMVRNWALWGPCMFVNFRFVPVNLQVLFANGVSLGWNTYMSYVSHLEIEPVSVIPSSKE